MTAPVRIDASAWGDLRFVTLARLCGFADADTALIKCAKIWSWQTEHFTDAEPTYVVDIDIVESALGPDGGAYLVRARLAEEGPGGLRIRGSEGRIEWLWKNRASSKRGGEATRRKHDNKEGPLGLPVGQPDAEPTLGPETGPNQGPLTPDLSPVKEISDTHATHAHAIRPVSWTQRKAWWDCMLEAHDRLRKPTLTRAAIKPNTPDLAKHPNELMLLGCERFLRAGGYDDVGIDQKMRHVVLVHEAEAEALGHLDFFKPAIIFDTANANRFPRKVDTTLDEARRAGSSSRAGPRRQGDLIGSATPRNDHPESDRLIPISEL